MSSIFDRVLDSSVIFGYTNLGYSARRLDRRPVTRDMSGKTVIVTGATSGLGEATAVRLGELGAEVVVVGRNPEKVNATLDRVGPAARGEVADLSSLAETRALAERLLENEPRIDVLVNNAGVLLRARSTTSEGLETSVATNVISHFLLTNLLIPKLIESAPSRIINISSGGMYTQPLNVDKMLAGDEPWDGPAAYARAKRAQVVLTEMWAEQLEGTGVTVASMHPGWADTAGVASGLPTFQRLTRPFLRDAAQGADTIVWLAADPEPADTSGVFWHDRTPRPTHRGNRTAERPGEREKLWATLAELTDTGA